MKKSILGIVSGLVITVGGGFLLHHLTKPIPPLPNGDTGGGNKDSLVTKVEEPPKCDETWEWDPETQNCIKKIVLSPKTFSIPLKETINRVDGRMDFYLNRERLPGTDEKGNAKYKQNNGVVQVVIPIMKKKRMVGSLYEVIYRFNKGYVCSIEDLPETTEWLKRMQVSYSLRLNTDCNKSGSLCNTGLVESGNRIHLTTKKMILTISKVKCD